MTTNAKAELDEEWDALRFAGDNIEAREKDMAEREAHLKEIEADVEGEVSRRVAGITAEKEISLKSAYDARNRALDDKHRKMIAGFKTRHYMVLGYGLLITVLEAIKSTAFRSEFAFFLESIFLGIKGIFTFLWDLGGLAAGLGDMIPQETVGTIVHWILQVAVSCGALVGIGYLCFQVFRIMKGLFKKYYKDEITVTAVLVIVAVAVVFADGLATLPVSLMLLCIIAFVAYMLIRGLVMWDNREAKIDLVMATVGVMLAIAMILYAGYMMDTLKR